MDRDLQRIRVHSTTRGQRSLIAMRGIACQPRFDLLKKLDSPIGNACLPERFERAREHGERPLSVEGQVGRQHTPVGYRPGVSSVGVVERNMFHATTTFKPSHGLALMREEMLHRAKQ